MLKKRNLQKSALLALFTDNKTTIGKLYEHAKYIQQLEIKLFKHLGHPLNTHCILANHANDTLTLHADSPSWATKLRYCTPDILSYMQQQCHLPTLKTVRIKVMPTANKTTQIPKRHLSLSAKSAKFIDGVATSMTDENLSRSLLKLSKHSRPG